jgi:branched-chain amino acid transport system ATP-binding protein
VSAACSLHLPNSAGSAMAEILRAEKLAVRFGGVQAVDGLSLSVQKGELIGLIGPNGAGKTTALKLLTGIQRPDTGQVFLNNADVTRLPVHRRARLGMAMTHQIVRPFRGLTALENVMIAAGHARIGAGLGALFSYGRTAERTLALSLLERVGLAGVSDRLAETLPLGQLKRLEVARALALDPVVALLDEPLAGLNSTEAEALAETIVELNGDGLTVILIEHNLGEVLRISRRLVVMVAGRIVADGEPASTVLEPVVQEAYVGADEEEGDR